MKSLSLKISLSKNLALQEVWNARYEKNKQIHAKSINGARNLKFGTISHPNPLWNGGNGYFLYVFSYFSCYTESKPLTKSF